MAKSIIIFILLSLSLHLIGDKQLICLNLRQWQHRWVRTLQRRRCRGLHLHESLQRQQERRQGPQLISRHWIKVFVIGAARIHRNYSSFPKPKGTNLKSHTFPLIIPHSHFGLLRVILGKLSGSSKLYSACITMMNENSCIPIAKVFHRVPKTANRRMVPKLLKKSRLGMK